MISMKEGTMLQEFLKSRGVKITKQRMSIIELMNEMKSDMQVDEIYDRLKEQGMGLTTVYRNVKLLEKEGILKEKGGRVKTYKINDFWKRNIYFTFKCVSCNHVVEIENSALIHHILNEKKNIEKGLDYKVDDISITLYGKCTDCK